MSMSSPSTHYITSRRMGIYEPIHQISMWDDFKDNGYPNASASMLIEVDAKLDNQSEDTSRETIGHSSKYDQEANKPVDKVLRRLAQNREAARKSRLRKKVYVQQLETSRLKLLQLEQELERTRQKKFSASGAYIGGGLDASPLGCSGAVNSGIAAFELKYGNWVEEQNRQICDLRTAMNSHLADVELRHVENISRTFFLWIGGFRPSELLKVLLPHLDLWEKQLLEVYNLIQSCQQAEDALSQGRDKLQQTLVDAVAAGQLGGGFYIPQIANAVEQLEPLVSFIDQADHIRRETLQQMHRILTTRQAAQGLVALGEYFQRLRALSSLWTTRPPRESA